MKILFDTNILLDVFLFRDPFYKNSAFLLGLAEQGKVEGWLCGTTVTTLYYLTSKALSRKTAKEHLNSLLKIFHVANINRTVLEKALESDFKDYEDAVLYQSALQANLNGIITRNKKDFTKSELPCYTPAQFLKILETL